MTLEICLIELETSCQKSASFIILTEGEEHVKEIVVLPSEARDSMVTRKSELVR
jgi:hypothetical protein